MYAFLLPGLGSSAQARWSSDCPGFDIPFLTKQPMELSALHSSVATATDREWVSQSCHLNPQRLAVCPVMWKADFEWVWSPSEGGWDHVELQTITYWCIFETCVQLVIKFLISSNCVLLLQDFLEKLGAFSTIEVYLAPVSACHVAFGSEAVDKGAHRLTPAVKQVVPSWDWAAVSEFQSWVLSLWSVWT